MATQTSNIRFSSESERKAYSRGLAEVQRKLASGKRKETAKERHERIVREGQELVLKRYGRDAFIRAFGREPSRTLEAVAPVKKYSSTVRHYSFVSGLFG